MKSCTELTCSTQWFERHDADMKIEYLSYRSREEADLFTNNRGTSKL